MDALLISPFQGQSIPWGILILGSYLTNVKRRNVRLFDANGLSSSESRRQLDHLLPDVRLVGISCVSPYVYYVKKIVDYIKKSRPETKIIVGGPHAILEPEQTCRYKNIDFVAYTYGEQTMDGLIDELSKDNPDYENVPGLIYKTDGETRRTEPPVFVGFYDTDYNLLPKSTRSNFHNYIQVFTGRGCPYRCRFCYNSVIRQAFHARPAVDMVKELEKLVNKYNPEVVYFRDENFFEDKKRAIDFIRLYKEKKFTFRWVALCRVSYFNQRYINAKFLRELESINCEELRMGIECGTQRVLKYLRKGITIKGIKRAVCEVAKSKTIKGNYSFMVGLPTQKVEEYIDTMKLIKFILRHEPDADINGPQYFRIYPGGSLYEEIVEKYGYTKPASFEDWAHNVDQENDVLSLYRDMEYSWIPSNGKYLAFHGNLLVQMYRKPIKDFFTPTKFAAVPFAILAKLRIKNDWYNHLYDIRLLVKLYNVYRRYLSPSAKTLTQ